METLAPILIKACMYGPVLYVCNLPTCRVGGLTLTALLEVYIVGLVANPNGRTAPRSSRQHVTYNMRATTPL